MRIIVWGLGPVGTVTAACLAKMGHHVVGIDKDQAKVDAIIAGRSPNLEFGLSELVTEVVSSGYLTAKSDSANLVCISDISLLCIGTPCSNDGETQLHDLETVCTTIGRDLRQCSSFHTVVLRSTVFPGVTRNTLIPILEESAGKCAGVGFGVAVNPEFLREGNAIDDFFSPPYCIVGASDIKSSEHVSALYQGIETTIHDVNLEEAELLKMINNAFHSLKISFANEIGRLCEPLRIDSHAIMRLVCADTKLNISSAYMRPGSPFGGSCLPKDLRAINSHSKSLGVQLPILNSILASNSIQLQESIRKVLNLQAESICIFGLSFKSGTGDYRESPGLDIACALQAAGVSLRIFEPDLNWETLPEQIRATLKERLPSIQSMLCSDFAEAISCCEAIVVCQNRKDFSTEIENKLHGTKIRLLDLTK